jgi:hypothetical protein
LDQQRNLLFFDLIFGQWCLFHIGREPGLIGRIFDWVPALFRCGWRSPVAGTHRASGISLWSPCVVTTFIPLIALTRPEN